MSPYRGWVMLTIVCFCRVHSNVGFDVRGDAKLFDFGLATEFDADKEKNKPFKVGALPI
jgi:hypothetical protein